jgi:catechol 2,3-dioxygenase-like lactoylglutathione lyase family enzyme
LAVKIEIVRSPASTHSPRRTRVAGARIPTPTPTMDLGAFSISLAVENLDVSKAFYAKLGFEQLGEQGEMRYAILKNGDHVIGLFEQMFEKNILTFNPGWDQSAQNLEEFTDVRDLADRLEASGLELIQRPEPDSEGPASIVLEDPDGNPILIDQHR